MARVAVIERTGGPAVIGWRDVALPPPGPGEVRVRHTAIGLNYIDTYHRSGLYPLQLPSGLGAEAAGVGQGVAMLAQGGIRPAIGRRWPLDQAADAHRALEAGETRGSSVLIP